MTAFHPTSRLRAATLWALCSLGLIHLLRWLAAELLAPLSPTSFDAVLVRACLTAVGVCAVWGWLVVGAVALEVVRLSSVPTAGVPTWARGLVLLACGVAAVGLAAPAGATDGVDLDGLPMPDRASGGFLAQTVRPAIRADRPVTQQSPASTHRVAAGDSLWSIAEVELGNASRWVEIYELNRRRIGADPDHIEVDQRLDLPH